MRQLVSKLLAGGLSAGVILLWWPQFFPGDSLQSWLVRGVAWTFSFELLLLALGSFEEALWDTRPARGVRSRVDSARVRLDPQDSRRRLRLRGAVAAAALLVPLALLATGLHGRPLPGVPATEVERVTEVTRIVKVERREAATTPAPAPAPELERAASPVPNAVRRAPAERNPAREQPRRRKAERQGERTRERASDDGAVSPTPEVTGPAPAVPEAAPQQQAPQQAEPDAGSSAKASAGGAS